MKQLTGACFLSVATLLLVGCTSFPSSPKPASGVSIEAFEARATASATEAAPQPRLPERALTSDGVALLKKFEGAVHCKGKASLHCPYDDPSQFCTIGYGHLLSKASCKEMKQTLRDLGYLEGISETVAEELLERDLHDAQLGVERHITEDLIGTTPLTEFQYDALVSLTFNIGAANFADSTVLRLLSKRKDVIEDQAIANAFSLWVKSKGEILAGLIARRDLEARHFFKDLDIDFSFENSMLVSEGNAIDIRLGERALLEPQPEQSGSGSQ